MWRTLAMSAVFAIAVVDVSISQRWLSLSGTHAATLGDNICGPRCVQLVLRHYGRSVDLVEAVREIQFPDIKSGASLADMRRMLEREGIPTAALSVPRGYSLNWPHPSLAHMPGRGRLGHYVAIVAKGAETEELARDGIADVRSLRTFTALWQPLTWRSICSPPVCARR